MLSDSEIVDRWKKEVVRKHDKLDAEADKGGHDGHSLWAGFVIGKGRPGLTSWEHYMRLGFPAETTE